MWEQLAGPLGDQGALLQGSQNWQDHPVVEVDFLRPGRFFPSASGLQSSSRGQVGLGSCSVGVQHLLRVGVAGGALRDKGALPQGSQNWQYCTAMEAYFPCLGRACSGVSGLQNSFSGLEVLGATPQGVAPPEGGQARPGQGKYLKWSASCEW